MNRFMKWAQAMDKRKKLLVALTIVSGITISGIALASNGWFSFDVLDLSMDNLKLTDTITLEDLPLWFDASVGVTGSGYVGEEHDVFISVFHTRSLWESAGDFVLFLENSDGTLAELITSGNFIGLRKDAPFLNPTYVWTPGVSAGTYTIALIIENVLWTEMSAHTITATADLGGTIIPSGEIPVLDGDPQGFMITPTPDSGYMIEDVLVDSVSVGAVSNYLFSAVTADHTINAYFGLAGTYSESNTTIDLSSGNLNGWTGTIETCTFNGETDLIIVQSQPVYLIVTVADDGTYAGWIWSYHFEAKRSDGSELHVIGSSTNGEILGDSPQQATVSFNSEAGIWHVILLVDSVDMPP